MQCTRCRRVNTIDAHYCTECGAALAQRHAPYPRLEHDPGRMTPVRPMAPDEIDTQQRVLEVAAAQQAAQSGGHGNTGARRAAHGSRRHTQSTRSGRKPAELPRRPRWAWWIALMAALAVSVALAGVWIARRPTGGASPTAASPANTLANPSMASSAASSAASQSSPAPSSSSPNTGTPQEAEVAALVQNYFSQAPSAPEKSWVMLTEEAQRNTGKQADYLAWWRTVASANAQLVRWAPDTQTATVSYQLVMQNGARKTLSARLPIVRASTGELQISSLSG